MKTDTFLREVALYYAAGLIDGEGSIQLDRGHAKREFRGPAVTLVSTTPSLVNYMKDHFGGQVIRKRKYKGHHREAFVWGLRGDKAIEFLHELCSRLREPEKSRRAYLIVARYKMVTPRNGKYTLEQREKKLSFEAEFFNGNARRRLAAAS